MIFNFWRPERMKVTFIGTGDAFGTGGRFQTCIAVETAKGLHLMDCGPSTLIAMNRMEMDPDRIDSICLSHLHGDHMGGLPFLILDAQYLRHRTRPLVIAGPPGTRDRVTTLLEVMFPGAAAKDRNYEIHFIELPARETTAVLDLRVTGHPVEHESGAPSYALRLEADGRCVAFTGDTQWCEGIVDASADADLLIAECFGFDRRVIYHNSHADLAAHADRLTARRIYLTHMGSEMLARQEEARWPRARDGLVLDLNDTPD